MAVITAVRKAGGTPRSTPLPSRLLPTGEGRGRMPGRYRSPQHASGTEDQTDELPLFRRAITPRALTWKSCQQHSSRASTLLTGYFPYL